MATPIDPVDALFDSSAPSPLAEADTITSLKTSSSSVAEMLVKTNLNQEASRNRKIQKYIEEMRDLQDQLKAIAKFKRKIERMKAAEGYSEIPSSGNILDASLQEKLAFAIKNFIQEAQNFLAIQNPAQYEEFKDIFEAFENSNGENFSKADLNDLNIVLGILADQMQNQNSINLLQIQPMMNEMLLLSKVTSEIIRMQQHLLDNVANKAIR